MRHGGPVGRDRTQGCKQGQSLEGGTMNHGGRPSARGSMGAWARTLAVACAGVLAFGGVAVAAPKGDPGPPEQAQGNGPPAQAPPEAKANGHAKQQAAVPTSRAGAGTLGNSGAHARGNAHSGESGEAAAGGGGSASSRSQAGAHSNVTSQERSSNGNAGKTTLCHATRSSSNPYVEITISNNGVPAHDRHQNDEDIIPAAGDCPGGTAGRDAGEHGNSNGKVTICHATGSETNSYVRITVSVNALNAHTSHQDGEDIVNPTGDCPSSTIPAGLGNPPSGLVSGAPESGSGETPASGVMGVSEQSPAPEGGVLGTQQGGVEGATQVADTSGGSLPFT